MSLVDTQLGQKHFANRSQLLSFTYFMILQRDIGWLNLLNHGQKPLQCSVLPWEYIIEFWVWV